MSTAPRLYHAPRTCSLAVRIAAQEGGVPLDIVPVDLGTHTLDDGTSFLEINPLGQVSVIRLPDGTLITETSACLVWAQSQSEDTRFRRDPPDPEFFQMLRWIGFCATELHKQLFRVVFYSEASTDVKDRFRSLVPDRLMLLETHLSDRAFLLGDRLSAADCYLAWALTLTDKAGIDITPYASLCSARDRLWERPSIRRLMEEDRVAAVM